MMWHSPQMDQMSAVRANPGDRLTWVLVTVGPLASWPSHFPWAALPHLYNRCDRHLHTSCKETQIRCSSAVLTVLFQVPKVQEHPHSALRKMAPTMMKVSTVTDGRTVPKLMCTPIHSPPSIFCTPGWKGLCMKPQGTLELIHKAPCGHPKVAQPRSRALYHMINFPLSPTPTPHQTCTCSAQRSRERQRKARVVPASPFHCARG